MSRQFCVKWWIKFEPGGLLRRIVVGSGDY